MKIGAKPSALREVKLWEYAVRFAFGGLVTAGAGLVSKTWGPAVGGLFLAFPAILPATLTLVKRHDGRRLAVEDARGARLGAAGLLVFAGVMLALAGRLPPWSALCLATLGWLAASLFLYLFDTSRAR